MIYPYNPQNGIAYARMYALYAFVPEAKRLFYYDSGTDCANFASQCIWAAYGGWVNGSDPECIRLNRERIRAFTRMAPYTWYGSADFSGSNKWCRVLELYQYAITPKAVGARGSLVAEGDWNSVKPEVIIAGDIIQLVVQSYMPGRYGHTLYVTKSGIHWRDVLICCHSYDRLDSPMSEFADNPDEYRKLRVIRLGKANFNR